MSEPYHHTPHPKPLRAEPVPGHERFFYCGQMQHTVEYVTISYRLALRGVTPVETMPSWREPSLPEDSVRVTLGDHVVVLTVDEWGGRDDELDAWLRAWIVERVSFSRASLASGRHHKDEGWMRVLRERGPWR